MALIHEAAESPLLRHQNLIMERVAESYELSPLQQGMLFHGIGNRESGVDIEQIACQLDEPLEVETFTQAWRQVVARHPILRTSFHWEGLPEPRQHVHPHVKLPVDQWDWRSLTAEEQEQRWTTLRADDRHRGFDLTHAPLLRLTIVACGPVRYRVLWTFHHILLDGRSFPVVLREVFTVYQALRDGQEIQLPSRPSYGEYITWLRAQDFTPAETYWRQQLQGFRIPTPLLTEKRGLENLPAKERWGAHEGVLSAKTTTALTTFARTHTLTLNTLLQGAWALLLHHYSGEKDVVFGATRACRPSTLTEAGATVGLFINTLPLRVNIDRQASLLPWLQEIRAQHLALRAYEHTPLVKIQHWSEVPRGLPLFDSILVFENYLLNTALRSQGGEWTQRRFHYTGQTNYPLTCIAYADSELLLRLEYDRQRFADNTVKRMLGHLQTLLAGMCTAPEQPLWRIPLLTHAEERRFLLRPNQPTPPSSSKECLHRWFESQAIRSPDAIALVYEGQSLTYHELNRRANQLAHRLQTLGVQPDVLVGLCVERSLDLVVSILAILKAGGAYLPIDLSYPPERVAFMLEDAAAPVLVTQRQFASQLPIHQAQIVYLDELSQDDELRELSAEDNLESQTTPDHLAYVIYTSGSTGKPKGVQVTHENVTRLFRMTEAWFSFHAQDVWTLFHSSAFDFSVWEIWGALLYGGRLVVVPYWVSRSPEAFCQLLQHEQVTVLNQTPSAFRQLLPLCIAAIPPEALSLRYVIFGGEALELQSLLPWMEHYGDQSPQVVNMYGITETTVHVTYRPLTLADVRSSAGSVIGRPIPDLHVYVLTPHRTLCPIGVPGEMYVGGAGVARGYLRRPELTGERFITDPFQTDTTTALYKTGDLARWLDNGDLEYLGRIDHQVKIRGFRIELGEIEAVLSLHPQVQEAIVLAREDAPGDKRLVAYMVTKDGTELEDIRTFLRKQLPEYMLPSACVRLTTLPLTTNGKVDRRALPPPDQERPALQQRYAAPHTAAEHTLCQLWSAVLGVKEVGVHDNFFELGGDSILSIQVIAKARQAGIQLTPKDLFQYPTIAEIAAHCSPSVFTQPQQGPVTGIVALTPIQHWFFAHDLPQRHYWNQAFMFEVPADLDSTLLEEALHRVVEHHDAFRLRFTQEPSGWSQSYAVDTNLFSCTRMNLSAVPQTEQSSFITSTITELQATLNLKEGPLLRAVHFWCGPHHAGRLAVVVHHLVIDGVSWRLLLEDLETAYLALQQQKPVQLPPKTALFQTWAAHLHEYARQPELQAEYAHWRSVADTQVTPLPVDNIAHGENWEADAETFTVRLSRAETDTLLHQAPSRHRAHINALLLAALRQCFNVWIGTQPLLIDLEGHGREEVGQPIDVSRTIGWFTTIFPVRLDAAPMQRLAQTLQTVKE
ncbi:MAG: amino acid adenylation domain-containing protein, partial [Candidatus Binatia bacterium]